MPMLLQKVLLSHIQYPLGRYIGWPLGESHAIICQGIVYGWGIAADTRCTVTPDSGVILRIFTCCVLHEHFVHNSPGNVSDI